MSKTIVITGAGNGETLQYQVGESVNDNNWIEYTSSFTIDENTTIFARLTDGVNVTDTETYTESKIDKTEPTITVESANVTAGSNSITII